MPITWKAHKRAQKDVDAKWTKKHGKNHFGYKLHASIDKRHKLVRKGIITNAAVSDSLIFEELLDPNNTSRDIYADRGYPSAEREAISHQRCAGKDNGRSRVESRMASSSRLSRMFLPGQR